MRSIDNILTLFLFCLSGAWSGNKQLYEFAEGGRGMLVTACRRSRLLDCRPAAKVQNERTDAKWLAWVESEKQKRLGLSIYVSLRRTLGLLSFRLLIENGRFLIVNTPLYSILNRTLARQKQLIARFPVRTSIGTPQRLTAGGCCSVRWILLRSRKCLL